MDIMPIKPILCNLVCLFTFACTNASSVESFKALDTFQDCPDCPKMVVIPAGSVTMGLPEADTTRLGSDYPPVNVNIPKSLAVAQHELTVGQFKAFARNTAWDDGSYPCDVFEGEGEWAGEQVDNYNWTNPGFNQTDNHPAVCISWHTAQAYAAWLSLKTGETYRLLSEAEFEYANRAGRSGYWIWDENQDSPCSLANTGDHSVKENYSLYSFSTVLCDDGYAATAPVMSYASNPFGLYDMTGNVNEWIQDCYLNNHDLTPSDGSALEFTNCPYRRVKGGSWYSPKVASRIVARMSYRPHTRITETGFRVARELE